MKFKLKPKVRFIGERQGIKYPNGKVRITDLSGNLIISYHDKDGETVNTNPVILDYAAEADIYLETNEGFIDLYDDRDVQIYHKRINELE